MSLEKEIFDEMLKEEYQQVKKKLKEEGLKSMTQDEKLLLLINLNTNHIYHLELDLKKGLNEVNGRIDKVNGRIDKLNDKIDSVEKGLNDKMDEKFEKMNTRIDSLFFKFIISMTFLLGVFKFLDKFLY